MGVGVEAGGGGAGNIVITSITCYAWMRSGKVGSGGYSRDFKGLWSTTSRSTVITLAIHGSIRLTDIDTGYEGGEEKQ